MKITPMTFVVSTGRCGTASITKFLSKSIKFKSVVRHEFINYLDYGVFTPDISCMGQYNHFGLNKYVINFFKNKEIITQNDLIKNNILYYFEGSHVLSKAGLVDFVLNENIPEKRKLYNFIFLIRNPIEIARSLIERNDMEKVENQRLWYLDTSYIKNNLKYNNIFKEKKIDNMCCWYVAEMFERMKKNYLELDKNNFSNLIINIADLGIEKKLINFLLSISNNYKKKDILVNKLEKINFNKNTEKRKELEDQCNKLLLKTNVFENYNFFMKKS